MWESCEAIRNTGSGTADDDNGNEDDDEEEVDVELDYRTVSATGSNTISGSTGSTREVDTMKDARQLYAWLSGLYELAGRL